MSSPDERPVTQENRGIRQMPNLSDKMELESDITLNDDEEAATSHGDKQKEERVIQHSSRPGVSRASSSFLGRTVSRISNRNIVDPGPPPEGGLKAWTQVAMAWIVCLTTWGYLNSFGIFQAYYTEALHESQSTISWVGSVQLWIVFFVSAFSGRALDAGLFLPTMLVGSILQLVGIFANSFCKTFWQLVLAQGLCTGLGSGIIFCPAVGLVSTYFSKKRALAIAFVSTGNSFGGAIYPVVVRQLLPKIGFAWTVRVLGFINLVCLVTAMTFMRPRLPPRKAGAFVEWAAFREVPYVLVTIGMSFVFGGLFFSYYFISSYGRNIIGLSYADSVNLTITFNGIGIPIRLLIGFLADRYTGPLNGIIPLLFLNSMFAFAWIGVSSRTGLYVFTAFYGLSAGAFQCLFPTTLTSLNTDLSKNGVRLGMAFTIFSFAGLTGPPIGGVLLGTNGGGREGFMAAQLGVGLATAFGSCLVVGARVYLHGWNLRIKC